MDEFFDSEGNLIDGAVTKEKMEEYAKKQRDEAIEQFKKDNPPKEEKKDEKKEDVKDPNTERLEKLENELRQERIGKFAGQFAGNDTEKQAAYKAAFNRLSGYEDTPEGREEHAKAAARLAFGSETGMDLGVAHTGGGRDYTRDGDTKVESEASKNVGKELGIKDDVKEKYAGEVAEVMKAYGQ